MQTSPRPRRPRSGPLALLLPLALGALSGCGEPESQGTMTVLDVVQEVMIGEDTWWPVAGTPRIDVISPSEHYKYDATDMVSLVLPAPCEVAFQAPNVEGEMLLKLGAGVDREHARLFEPGQPGRFLFTVLKNGKSAFEVVIEVHKELDLSELIWRRPEGGGIACEAGDEFRLRTRMLGPEVPAGMDYEPKIGFSDLRFEQTAQVERQVASPEAPSIIYIVQDTMRYDRSTLADPELALTPNLQALAQRGVQFHQAYSTSSWTWPSTASLMTGLLPDAHGVVSNESCYLPTATDTLAEVLQLRGYTTGAFSRNPLVVPDKGFAQGFETFDSEREFVKTKEFLPDVEAWLEQQGERRFFLYLHLADPHSPLEALRSEVERLGLEGLPDMTGDEVEKLLGPINKYLLNQADYDARTALDEAFGADGLQRIKDLYDACVASGDYYVGRVMAKLAELGLEDRTIVAFTSDHGEEWMEHDMLRHSHALFQELVRVPLLIAGPGFGEGLEVQTPVSNRHLPATLALFGGTQLGDVAEAVDLARLAEEPVESVGPVYFSTHHGFWEGRRQKKIYGVRDGDWVLHFGEEQRGEETTFGWRLYNLADDPAEQVDLSAQHPAKVDELRRLIEHNLEVSLAFAEAKSGNLRVPAAGATLEMLGNIGYLDGLEDQ